MKIIRTGAALLLGAAVLGTLPACAPLIIGGAMVGGVLVATDRRTTGAQVEDEAIELKSAERVNGLGTLGHINVTSYNRMALITGEVPNEAARSVVEQAVARIDNVRSVVNELALVGNSSLTARSNDTLLSGQVKTALVNANDVVANSVKVVTERSTVYLMGRVTEREAQRAAEIASTVSGVQKVVRVFEILSEDELARLQLPAR